MRDPYDGLGHTRSCAWIMTRGLRGCDCEGHEEKVKVGHNLNSPVMYVIHRQLRRISEDSPFRSACVKCKEGVLLFLRDQETLELEANDYCIFCGQRYHYLDIEEVKTRWDHQKKSPL